MLIIHFSIVNSKLKFNMIGTNIITLRRKDEQLTKYIKTFINSKGLVYKWLGRVDRSQTGVNSITKWIG